MVKVSVITVVPIWSGNEMSGDEPFSLTSKIISGSGNTRKGIAINQIIVGVLLLIFHVMYFSFDSASQSALSLKPYVIVITSYAVFSLIAMAYIVVNRSFITPEVKSPKCHFCGEPMKTAKLICNNCESDSNKGKT